MLESEVCSSQILSPCREESGDEELSLLPRHTKVIVTGNNRTKSVLVGLQGVVKKAVGLGGWHWLVLKNGVEVKLQRNALSVLEAPSGHEEEDDNSFCSSSDLGDKENDCFSSDYHKPNKPRVRPAKHWMSSTKSSSRSSYKEVQSSECKAQTEHMALYKAYYNAIMQRVNLAKLETEALWRYWKHFNLMGMNPKPSKKQLVHAVQRHFWSQQLDEIQVITGFIHAAKRLKTV